MSGHRDSQSARGIPAVHCGEDVKWYCLRPTLRAVLRLLGKLTRDDGIDADDVVAGDWAGSDAGMVAEFALAITSSLLLHANAAIPLLASAAADFTASSTG